MKIFITLAKVSMVFVWFILLINLFFPYPGKIALFLYIMTGFLFMMHALQAAIFIGAFGDKLSLSSWDKWSILLFGVFALLDIRRKYMLME